MTKSSLSRSYVDDFWNKKFNWNKMCIKCWSSVHKIIICELIYCLNFFPQSISRPQFFTYFAGRSQVGGLVSDVSSNKTKRGWKWSPHQGYFCYHFIKFLPFSNFLFQCPFWLKISIFQKQFLAFSCFEIDFSCCVLGNRT